MFACCLCVYNYVLYFVASQNIHNILTGIHYQQLWNVIMSAVIALYIWIKYVILSYFVWNYDVSTRELSIACHVEFCLA